MIAGHDLTTHRAARTVGICVLLLALALALPLDGNQPFHSHEAGTAGIYNGDCPLAALAAFHSVGLLGATPSPAWVRLLAGAALPAIGARLFARVARHTDPRAPPLV